jgi:hypothetical protein
MPAERTAMRQVREVLRLKFFGGVPIREIARRIGSCPWGDNPVPPADHEAAEARRIAAPLPRPR